MPSLLTMPAELRALVITQALHNRTAPPSTPSKTNRIDFEDIDYMAWRSRSRVYHEQRGQHCPSNALPLLLTNRQLCAETQALIDIERQKSNLQYHLEISVLDDHYLFVTWLSVPWISNRLDSLVVDIRMFGHILSQSIARSLGGDGGCLGFHWGFYAILERFLRYGPVDEKKMEKPKDSTGYHRNPTFEDRDMTVKELTLRFESAEDTLPFPPNDVDYSRWNARQRGLARFRSSDTPDKLQNYRTRPEWLAKYLLAEIGGLLHLGYHTAEYGRILYERIGTLRVVVEGEDFGNVDIAAKLADLSFHDTGSTFGHVWPREERIPTFWRWKRDTLARRQQLGFPVVWPEDMEST